MMHAKVVHDNINAGGGSERLTVITIDLLIKMGFKVDLASFNKLDIEQLKKYFGDVVNTVDINPIPLDLFSMIGLTDAAQTAPTNSEAEGTGSANQLSVDAYSNNKDYTLIINTHGDVLPYYDQQELLSKRRIITYCHFPIVPQLMQEDLDLDHMPFIKNWINIEKVGPDLKQKLIEKIGKTYDLMMTNTIVLTNSYFSKRAIEKLYGSAVKPIVIYPPVDVEKFRTNALHSNERENLILVISRFSPDKQLENVVDICRILVNDLKLNANMVLVGNIAAGDDRYLEMLRRLTQKHGLNDNLVIEVDASFDRLLELMRKSKVYLHPFAGEPFGISTVEAMSAGLIPVVPDEGGYTEFVPEYYQFHTHQQAADIIGKILIASDNNMQTERDQLSESVSKFSNERYQAELRKVIESLLPSNTLIA
jgi:glycosyltransferase involved in cell wall biosynthesis